jgi:hypothetical protein
MPHRKDTANRVIIFTKEYLDFGGNYAIGGRQRFVRDLALPVQE